MGTGRRVSLLGVAAAAAAAGVAVWSKGRARHLPQSRAGARLATPVAPAPPRPVVTLAERSVRSVVGPSGSAAGDLAAAVVRAGARPPSGLDARKPMEQLVHILFALLLATLLGRRPFTSDTDDPADPPGPSGPSAAP